MRSSSFLGPPHFDSGSSSNTGFPCVINLHVFDTFVLCTRTVQTVMLQRNGVMRRQLRANNNKVWGRWTIQWRKGASAKRVTSASSSAVVVVPSPSVRPSVSAGYRGRPDGGMKPSEPRLSSARRFRGSCCRSTLASPERSGAGIAPMMCCCNFSQNAPEASPAIGPHRQGDSSGDARCQGSLRHWVASLGGSAHTMPPHSR
jgi:hypothetical protein